jgi:hypothetical protein
MARCKCPEQTVEPALRRWEGTRQHIARYIKTRRMGQSTNRGFLVRRDADLQLMRSGRHARKARI